MNDFTLDGLLQKVEDALRSALPSHPGRALRDPAAHLVLAGGKRVRPRVTLATGLLLERRLDSAAVDRMVKAAAAVELLHVASLIHDDMIDCATTRRGVPSVNDRWGAQVALLTGDILLATSVEVAAGAWVEAGARLATTFRRLCEGQSLETSQRNNFDRTMSDYFEAIDGKTAALFGLCCELGARAVGATDTVEELLSQGGHALGLAFQLLDDLLDLTGDPVTLGKPICQDLREGVVTYPIIFAMERDPALRETAANLDSVADPGDFVRAIEATGAFDATMSRARDELARARRAFHEASSLGSSTPQDSPAFPDAMLAPMLAALPLRMQVERAQ